MKSAFPHLPFTGFHQCIGGPAPLPLRHGVQGTLGLASSDTQRPRPCGKAVAQVQGP